MPRSQAQIAASRLNGMRSRGPVTAEGKAAASRNSYKHGLAGEGIVTTPEAAAEVQRRSTALMIEMRPVTTMGAYFVRRLARLTVRVERAADEESASHAHRADHAAEAFDDARLSEMENALGRIGAEPATYARRLRSMPEGVDRVVDRLLDLREELNTGRWDWNHGEMVANLMGHRFLDVPATRVRTLSEAIGGDFSFLIAGDGEGLAHDDRVNWARQAMADLIDDELARLRDHRATLDLDRIARDRASARDRAGFDPSKEATLARRYEAAAERALFKTMDEFRRVEAEAAATGPAEAPIEADPDEPEPDSLGSSRAPSSPPPSPRPHPASAPRFAAPMASREAEDGGSRARSGGI